MVKGAVVIFVGVVGLGGLALAAGPEGPGKDERGFREELALSEDQMAQLRKLRMEHRRASIQRRADLELARLDLHELTSAATVDEKAVNAKLKELSDLQSAALRARVDGHLALRKILTPEQQKKMQALKHRHRTHRKHQMRHRGRDGRPGPAGRRHHPKRGPVGEDLGEEMDPGRRADLSVE